MGAGQSFRGDIWAKPKDIRILTEKEKAMEFQVQGKPELCFLRHEVLVKVELPESCAEYLGDRGLGVRSKTGAREAGWNPHCPALTSLRENQVPAEGTSKTVYPKYNQK